MLRLQIASYNWEYYLKHPINLYIGKNYSVLRLLCLEFQKYK